MSIDISFQGKKKKSFFSREISYKKFEQTLHTIARPLNAECHVLSDNKFELELCPTGIIELLFNSGNIEGGAQGNLAGPGFHKATIDFLDTLSTQLSAEFDVEDEARYANRRNFKELQQEYITFLTSLVDSFTRDEMDIKSTWKISWPLDSWWPAEQEGLFTPMGKYTHEQFKSIIHKHQVESFASNYFIWFNATKDAWFHRGVALYLMWNEFPWTKPRNEEEERIAEKILFHLDAAKKIDPSIPLPVEEWQELASLARKNLVVTSQNNLSFATKIGYLRNDILIPCPDGWVVQLPGSFLLDEDEEGEFYWGDLRKFRMNTHTAEEEYQFIFSEELEKPCTSTEKLITYQVDRYDYKAKYRFMKDKENPQGKWILHGQIMSLGTMAIVTITWQTDALTEWAIATFKNIQGPAT